MLDSEINRFIERNIKYLKECSGRPKLDYIVGAVLSFIIKDGRGPRWFDIYETIRWLNRDLISVFGKQKSFLHTNEYDQEQLKEQARYVLNNPMYQHLVEELKNKFFPHSNHD